MKINEKLKELRSARGLSIRALSALTGVNISNLSQIESGKTSPTFETIEKICIALGAKITITKVQDDNNDNGTK